MRRWTATRRKAPRLPTNQYQLDFSPSVCDNNTKAGTSGGDTPLPPNHGKEYSLTMTTSHLISDRTTSVKPTPRRTYPQDWPSYNAAQTSEKDTLQALLADLCATVPQPVYAFGRPSLPVSDMIYTAALKVYSGFSSRRFNCDAEEAQRKGYIDVAPSVATVNRSITNADFTSIIVDLIEKSAGPLVEVEENFAVDSTNFSTCRFDQWFNHKWGKDQSRNKWVKEFVS